MGRGVPPGFDQFSQYRPRMGVVWGLLDATVAGLGQGFLALNARRERRPAGGGSPGREPPIRLAFVGSPTWASHLWSIACSGGEGVGGMTSPAPPATPSTHPSPGRARVRAGGPPAACGAAAPSTTLTEAVSAKMGARQLARADVVALVIDAQNGATAEDGEAGQLHRGVGPGCAHRGQQGRPHPSGRDLTEKLPLFARSSASWRGRRWWSPLRSRDVALVKSRR